MNRRRTAIGTLIGVITVGLVVGVSAIWPGLDARDTPPVDTGVWALQTADGSRYARVNTAIGELDTVRSVERPSTIVQNAGDAYVLSDSYARVTHVDSSSPVDLDDETVRSSPQTPVGTTGVVAAGDFVAYRTDAGAIYAGRLSASSPVRIDPYADLERSEDAPDYAATAVAVTPTGVVLAYSAADKAVLRYRIEDGEILGTDVIDGVGDAPQLTAVGDTWFLFDADQGRLWQQGVDDVREIDTTGTVVLAKPAETGEHIYLADEGGLVRIPVQDAPVERVIGGSDNDKGLPVRPAEFGGSVYAAWLGSESGTLWQSGKGETALDYGAQRLDDNRRAAFVASGSTMILNEFRRGWVWTVPDGVLLPSSQDWSIDDDVDKNADPSEEQAEVVLDPKPPVAEADTFGVRPGAVASLPVLLNDHDPNRDVLTIDPGSVTGLDPAFGTVGVTDAGGRLAVTVAPGATGTATFSYTVSDGTSSTGLTSEPTTVTLVAKGDEENTPPQFCGVERCLASWPKPELRPGGATTVPVLNGWVDPEGDPLLVLSATAPEGMGTAAVTMRGDVVYRHDDTAVTAAQVVPVDVIVADATGQRTVKSLKITVTPTPTLLATSFTELSSLGSPLSIDVAPHVQGTSGDIALTGVELLDAADAEVTMAAGGTRFDLSAKEAGTYRVHYSVTDGTSEADATARITLLAADAPATLATPPVVAFVRPQEDATIDVLAAVSNPTGRVLLVSEAMPVRADGANLQVDTVGQNFLRVTGTTASGEPGRLGVVNYTVSDGSADSGASVQGQASVYLLPPANDLAPIAADDALIVRAGAQIDVPVLENDVAPSGAALVLDPSTVKPSDESALAFASGSTLRYLAPTKPGTYTVDYGVYAAGTPSVLDYAKVRVRVVGDETQRPPRPKPLGGRALSGQSTVVTFDSYGVDPDGDQVMLDRIMTQPARGTASITPDGQGIVYASTPGSAGGQDTFTYRVVDASGAKATGIVRIGVIDQESNPAPITFTDYVQVTVGQKEPARVLPLKNDIDPNSGELTLAGVIPNIAERVAGGGANPEYTRWNGLLSAVTDTSATIAASDEPGTMSYLYDVVSASGNTARGLIIVKTVKEIVQDYPVVSDTVLTTETRDQLASGLDVLTDKVTWTGGDVSNLKLGLWKPEAGISASGWKLTGDPGDDGRTIAFSVGGTLSDGTPLTTYAFVRIPAADDVSVSLRPGTAAFTVKEKESVDFDMRSVVVMPPGVALEVDSAISTTRARGQASCTLSGATTVTYSAGEGAPWSDSCIVPVRVAGQEEWTFLSVPVTITALDPVPVLKPASMTVIPGARASFDILDMVSWEGREDWDSLKLSIDAPGGDVTISQEGTVVTASAADAATPGQESAIVVSVSSHPDVKPARLTVRVGPAPSDLPRAGTTSLTCSQASGSSCEVRVVGLGNESNPFPETPLVMQPDSLAYTCSGVSFSATADGRVVARWNDDTSGTSCAVQFTLRDAQNRLTNGDRVGTVNFTLEGFPSPPAGLRQVGYGDGEVRLQVDPGSSQRSSPAITGFRVTSDSGRTITCATSGVCADTFRGLENNDKTSFSVVSVNKVGASRGSAPSTTAWAYAPPKPVGGVKAVPALTRGEGLVVELTVTGIKPATDELLVQAAGAEDEIVRVGSQDSITTEYKVNSNTSTRITVTPRTTAARPPGDPIDPNGGSTTGGVKETWGNGIGNPGKPKIGIVISDRTFGTSTVTVDIAEPASSGGDGSALRYVIVRDGESCSPADASSKTSRVFTKLPNNAVYGFSACAYAVSTDGKTVYGDSQSPTVERQLDADDTPPTGYTFMVDPKPIPSGNRVEWLISSDPTGPKPPQGYETSFSGYPTKSIATPLNISVRWKSTKFGVFTQPSPVPAAPDSAPYQVAVRWGISCIRGEELRVNVVPEVGSDISVNATSDLTQIAYFDKNGDSVLPDDPTRPLIVPETATKVFGIGVNVEWGAGAGNLDDYSADDLVDSCTKN